MCWRSRQLYHRGSYWKSVMLRSIDQYLLISDRLVIWAEADQKVRSDTAKLDIWKLRFVCSPSFSLCPFFFWFSFSKPYILLHCWSLAFKDTSVWRKLPALLLKNCSCWVQQMPQYKSAIFCTINYQIPQVKLNYAVSNCIWLSKSVFETKTCSK